MAGRTGAIVVFLILAFLMTLPQYVPVHAVTQNASQQTTFSPFGPSMKNLVIHDYSDFNAMFRAFNAGSVDITDWPADPADITAFGSNPDMWLSRPEPEFGIFQLDINNHASMLGIRPQTPRLALVGSVVSGVPGATGSCQNGFGLLTLNVANLENATSPFKDALNSVTIRHASGSPSYGPVLDSGISKPNGTYIFPCALAGPYVITATMVWGNATTGTHLACGSASGCIISVPAGSGSSGGTLTATWNVVWQSQSNATQTQSGIWFRKAVNHLLDKPNFVQNVASLSGQAACDDIMLAPAHLIPGSPCRPAASGQPGTPFSQTVLNNECSDLSLDTIITTCNPYSAYNLVNDIGTLAKGISGCDVWWGADGCANGANSGYSGLSDIDAACQYLVKAGFTITPVTTPAKTCVDVANASTGPACTAMPCTYAHLTGASSTLIFYVRTHAPRKAFGVLFADNLNFLFGTPNHLGQCMIIVFKSLNTCVAGQTAATVVYGTPTGTYSILPTFATIAQVVPIVFGSIPADDWNFYTGGFSLGTTPDSIYTYFNSAFSSNLCSGTRNDFPSNYLLVCDPYFDALSKAGEFQPVANPTLSQASSIFGEGAVREFQAALNDPVFSRIQQFVALNGWNWQQYGAGTGSSIAITAGHGTQTGYSALLNLRQLPGYDPCTQPGAPANCALYKPGGGDPNTIRRGFSQDPDTVNQYQALTVWDFEIISQVFDTLLALNPNTGGANQQIIDWMTTSHSSKYDPNELGCIPPPSVPAPVCANGVTTQLWHLRNDLSFHDGSAVTADDVVYSLLTTRDDPSANLFSNAAFITNAVALDSRTVQVKLQSNSAFYEVNIGSIPIIPKRLWGSVCGTISLVSTAAGTVSAVSDGPSSFCADPNFDPLLCIGTGFPDAGSVPNCGKKFADGSVQGIFVGSGPWQCKNAQVGVQASGKIGGSCILSSNGAPLGGAMVVDSNALLTANDNYMRGSRNAQGNSLQKLSWADQNNDGVVNILDASNAAFFFDQPNPYWVHPQYSCSPTATVVDICVMSALIVYFDEGLTKPYGGTGVNPSTLLTNMDPQIDPYDAVFTSGPGCTSIAPCEVYYQTTTNAKTQLAILSGAASAASFIASAQVGTGTSISGTANILGNILTITWSTALDLAKAVRINIAYGGTQLFVPALSTGTGVLFNYAVTAARASDTCGQAGCTQSLDITVGTTAGTPEAVTISFDGSYTGITVTPVGSTTCTPSPTACRVTYTVTVAAGTAKTDTGYAITFKGVSSPGGIVGSSATYRVFVTNP